MFLLFGVKSLRIYEENKVHVFTAMEAFSNVPTLRFDIFSCMDVRFGFNFTLNSGFDINCEPVY